MNTRTRLYWIVKGLMSTFMLMASIPDVLRIPQAVELFTHLGYPTYLLPFLGTAKILAVIAILVPGFPRIREWAYAGLSRRPSHDSRPSQDTRNRVIKRNIVGS
jgi:uncharacterized membrane protein YphA (DoxX/SURF4 family)